MMDELLLQFIHHIQQLNGFLLSHRFLLSEFCLTK